MNESRGGFSRTFVVFVLLLVVAGIGAFSVINHPSWLMVPSTHTPMVARQVFQQKPIHAGGMPVFVKKPVHIRGIDPSSVLPQPENELVFYGPQNREVWREPFESEYSRPERDFPTWSMIEGGKMRFDLRKDPESLYKIQVQYEKGVIVYGSNEHATILDNYKHGQSQWLDVPINEPNEASITYDEQIVPNIALNPDEVRKGIAAMETKIEGEQFGNPTWQLIAVRFRVLKKTAGSWTEIRQIEFENPWSC